MLILLDAQDLQWYRTKPATARRNITLHNPTPVWHTLSHTHTHLQIKTKSWSSHAVQSATSHTLSITLSKNKHKPRKTRSNTFKHISHCVDRKHTETHTHKNTHQYMRRQITYWKEECGFAVEQNSSFHACPPRLSTLCPPSPPPPWSSSSLTLSHSSRGALSPLHQKHWS